MSLKDLADVLLQRSLKDIKKHYPQVHWVVGTRENHDEDGIHLIAPDEVEIMEATELAIKKGFKKIYIHV